jgi:tetratricopeptide (TPR) repeat protein
MAIFDGFRAARLTGRVNRNMTTAVRLMQSRQPEAARSHNAKATFDVMRLMVLEPDNLEHVRMAGTLHYNMAAIFEQLGQLDEAVKYARLALAAYSQLPGGDVTPENIPMLGLLSIRATFGPPAVNPQEALEAVAYVADVKARLARLLARSEGASAAAEVHELGRAAIATYEQLAKAHPQRRPDLARVQSQYEEAKRALAAR